MTVLLQRVTWSSTELTSQQAQIADTLKRQCPGFACASWFLVIAQFCAGKGGPPSIAGWKRRAKQISIHFCACVDFETGPKRSGRVEAAVSEPWSNGPVEGQLNRLKMLKRQMYGLAGIELLRARLLPEPEFSDP